MTWKTRLQIRDLGFPSRTWGILRSFSLQVKIPHEEACWSSVFMRSTHPIKARYHVTVDFQLPPVWVAVQHIGFNA